MPLHDSNIKFSNIFYISPQDLFTAFLLEFIFLVDMSVDNFPCAHFVFWENDQQRGHMTFPRPCIQSAPGNGIKPKLPASQCIPLGSNTKESYSHIARITHACV